MKRFNNRALIALPASQYFDLNTTARCRRNRGSSQNRCCWRSLESPRYCAVFLFRNW